MAVRAVAVAIMPQTLLIVVLLINPEQQARCMVVVAAVRELVLMGFQALMVRFALFGREISAPSPPLAQVICDD